MNDSFGSMVADHPRSIDPFHSSLGSGRHKESNKRAATVKHGAVSGYNAWNSRNFDYSGAASSCD
jgi:hypothetical protein